MVRAEASDHRYGYDGCNPTPSGPVRGRGETCDPAYAAPPGSMNGSSSGNRWSLADARTTGYRPSRLRRLFLRPQPGRRSKGGDVATRPAAGNGREVVQRESQELCESRSFFDIDQGMIAK